jgi:thiol:disulfide interchange protein
MKNHFLTIAAIGLFAAAAFGQTSTTTTAVADDKPKEEPIARERFDPKKDPRADLDAAMKVAQKTGKNIVLDIGGEWCGWCVFMDKFFVQNPDIAKMKDANFVWVKVNYSKENENKEFLSPYPQPAGYPHLFVLDAAGKLLQSQDTSELEEGKGYNHDRFAEFLKKWSPAGQSEPVAAPAQASPAAKAN